MHSIPPGRHGTGHLLKTSLRASGVSWGGSGYPAAGTFDRYQPSVFTGAHRQLTVAPWRKNTSLGL